VKTYLPLSLYPILFKCASTIYNPVQSSGLSIKIAGKLYQQELMSMWSFLNKKRSPVRIIAVLIIMMFLMLWLTAQIYSLISGRLSEAAEKQSGSTITVGNVRGTIYDCNLVPLVNTASEYRIASVPSPEAISLLTKRVDSSVMEMLSDRIHEGRPIVATIPKITIPTEGMVLFNIPVRYTLPLPAPHVMGYMDGDGIHGAVGAELIFDEILHNASGKAAVTYTVDAAGRAMQGMPYTVTNTLNDARAGVALTIDSDIQKIAETAAKEHIKKGAVIVMKPESGHISAMVSLPDFQPNTIADNLNNPDSPLLNRALCNYNIGSVFKIVTAITALESGISTGTIDECTGSVSIGGITFHCHHRLGHGTLNMTEAFSVSCNPYFINLNQQTNISALYNQATLLGFDRPIYIADAWKTSRAVLPSETELLSPAAAANLSFGQGALMASPVHIAQLVAAVVNDGKVIRPTLLCGTVDSQSMLTGQPPAPAQTAFSPQTAAILRRMMVDVTENGTGKTARPISGGAGGKTGTAETGITIDNAPVVQGWFAGFYPAENPEYVIVVLAENTDGDGGKAAPVFKEICRNLSLLTKQRNIIVD